MTYPSEPIGPDPLDHGAHGTGSAPGEPVAISQAINTLVVALVSAGWFTLDSTILNAAISLVGAAIVLFSTIKARSKVTPTG